MSLQSHQVEHDEVKQEVAPKRISPIFATASLQGKKILVIDDDPDLRLGLHIRLRANYFDTCFAGDAESAINVAIKQMPDLIILDLGLPGDDGYAVMERLKAFPGLAGVPVIVLSGRDRYTHEKRVLEAGARQFWEKPVDNDTLLRGIRHLLR